MNEHILLVIEREHAYHDLDLHLRIGRITAHERWSRCFQSNRRQLNFLIIHLSHCGDDQENEIIQDSGEIHSKMNNEGGPGTTSAKVTKTKRLDAGYVNGEEKYGDAKWLFTKSIAKSKSASIRPGPVDCGHFKLNLRIRLETMLM